MKSGERGERTLERPVAATITVNPLKRADCGRVLDRAQPALGCAVPLDERVQVIFGHSLDEVGFARLEPGPEDQHRDPGEEHDGQTRKQESPATAGRPHSGFVRGNINRGGLFTGLHLGGRLIAEDLALRGLR
jgi:hypothetical protein